MPRIKLNKFNNDNNSDDVSRNMVCCLCVQSCPTFCGPWSTVHQDLSMETVEIVHDNLSGSIESI